MTSFRVMFRRMFLLFGIPLFILLSALGAVDQYNKTIVLSSTNTNNSNPVSQTNALSALNTGSALKTTYDERLAMIRGECLLRQAKYNKGRVSLRKWVNMTVAKRPRIYVSDKYKFAVCAVPKCGTTQWRTLLSKLENDYKEASHSIFKPEWEKRFLWTLHDISTHRGYEAAERKLNEYYRIMTVREPLERLVSAYKDKLEKLTHMGPISKELHRKYGNGSEGLATFSDFVDSILGENSPVNLNIHWKPFTDSCFPCLLNFNIIAKLETINHDFPYIANKLHIRRNSVFSDKSDTLNDKWGTKYHDYYMTLSKQQRLKIFEYYKPQYDYFGYPYPNYI